jgi:hypothetical protein
MHPLHIALAQIVGSGVVSEILGQFMPEPGRAAVGERVRATGAFLPELERAARGEPTAATEAQISRLGEEVTRYKQAAGAGARRAGVSRTIPGRAPIERLEAARIRGVADILGRGQATAQAQLMGMAPQALTMQREIEMGRRAAAQSALQDIAGIFADAKLEEERGVADARYTEMLDKLRAALMSLLGGGARAGGGGAGLAGIVGAGGPLLLD